LQTVVLPAYTFFFFQAEDGIRDFHVTGVQTCALPIFMVDLAVPRDIAPDVAELEGVYTYDVDDVQRVVSENAAARAQEAERAQRSEERRVGKESRSRVTA